MLHVMIVIQCVIVSEPVERYLVGLILCRYQFYPPFDFGAPTVLANKIEGGGVGEGMRPDGVDDGVEAGAIVDEVDDGVEVRGGQSGRGSGCNLIWTGNSGRETWWGVSWCLTFCRSSNIISYQFASFQFFTRRLSLALQRPIVHL